MTYVIVPTLNAAKHWPKFAPALLSNIPAHKVLIVDSSSNDGTPELAKAAGFRLVSISRAEFNHGGTRQMAVEMFPDAEMLVFLTQDAILAGPDSIAKLLNAFNDPTVAVAYGRQLPSRVQEQSRPTRDSSTILRTLTFATFQAKSDLDSKLYSSRTASQPTGDRHSWPLADLDLLSS